jgi:hypothetical protein
VQAPLRTSDVTAEAFNVADRSLLHLAGAIGPEEGGTDAIDKEDGDSTDPDHLVDDGDRRAPPPRRPGRDRISLNDRNAAVRSELADKWFARKERCARSSPSASR